MKRISSNQQGFGFVAVLAVAVILGAVGFAGVRVMNNNQTDTAANSPSFTRGVPAKISNTADLNNASAALDSTPIDSGINPDSLDKDLNAIL